MHTHRVLITELGTKKLGGKNIRYAAWCTCGADTTVVGKETATRWREDHYAAAAAKMVATGQDKAGVAANAVSTHA